jgi:hypothetical protein
MADVANTDGMAAAPGARMPGGYPGSDVAQQPAGRGHELGMTAAAVTDRQAQA